MAVAAAVAMGSGLTAAAAPQFTESAPTPGLVVESTVPLRPDLDTTLSRVAERQPLADLPDAPGPSPSAVGSAEPVPTPSEAAPAPAPATATRYATVGLNVRAEPNADAALVDQIAAGTAVTTIGDAADGWQQVQYNDATAYVAAEYLAATKPAPATTPAPTATKKATTTTATSGTTTRTAASGGYPACPSGSSVESGLTSRAITVHRAVCSTFPSITGFGGWRGDGEHASGQALDVMVSGSAGRAVAEWARANAGTLGIQTVIYQQQIWTVQRSSEGWRWMSDRGSATANHYDHVHIQVY